MKMHPFFIANFIFRPKFVQLGKNGGRKMGRIRERGKFQFQARAIR